MIETTVEERAELFAKKAIENLKSGKITRDTRPNSGTPFSIERDTKLVQNHKELLASEVWKEFLTEVQ
ncbi:MAG: hypothetical protein FWF81_05630 [Defluviitaleaceae bacterium]|nr:hypothetical protein [Defluviitaleaceae bacterium]